MDLDETLVFTSKQPLGPNSIFIKETKGYLNLRPHLKQFLTESSAMFNLVLFTASEQYYADSILKVVDPKSELFSIRLYRSNCVMVNRGIYLKHLGVLHGLNIEKTMFVDNLPFHLYENLNNLVPIVPYNGQSNDRELLKLLLFLRGILSFKNYPLKLRDQFKMHLFRECASFQELVLKLA